MGPKSGGRSYGVRLVRGPFVRLEPHEDHCRDATELRGLVRRLRRANPRIRLAADLFSGGGGLSLGLRQAGYTIVLSVDHDPDAVETHAHHFPGLATDWDLGLTDNVERVAQLVSDLKIELLAGGPPCQPFSKAGRSMIRHRVRHGMRDPHDERRDLWRSFLEIVRLARPPAVLMENVPDMALDHEMFILRSVVEELEQLGYAVEERVVDCSEHGVPQFRQRLIVVALRDGLTFDWPPVAAQQVTVWNAIGDMPEVAGGWRPEGGADGWIPYDGPQTAYQLAMREGVGRRECDRLYDHITRPVREDDAVAFEHMDTKTRYSQLPEDVKRYRQDIFDDKYKRLDENNLSRTITAHIAKDGYWYIHPRQGRTLTVREAARLQSFPDWFRFAGPPSAAFRQIGNAVPPILARQLGSALQASLDQRRKGGVSTQVRAQALAEWFRGLDRLDLPWLASENRWLVILCELLLERLPAEQTHVIWPAVRIFDSPAAAITRADDLREVAAWVGRSERVDAVLAAAQQLVDKPHLLEAEDASSAKIGGVSEVVTDLSVLAASPRTDVDEPVQVTRGVLRVARAYFGDERLLDRQNKYTDGRLAVARLIGGGDDARSAHLALIELAASRCVQPHPRCSECPLAADCASATGAGRKSA